MRPGSFRTLAVDSLQASPRDRARSLTRVLSARRNRNRLRGCPARPPDGQSIVIKGEIIGDENLVIAGRVEGRIHLGGHVLTLAPGSHVAGDIVAGTLVLLGQLHGTVEAANRLEVHAGAVVDGHLSAPSIVIADGAHVCATVEMPAREQRGKAQEAA